MDYSNFLNTLQVGVPVAFVRRHRFSGQILSYGKGVITKINRWGHITVLSEKGGKVVFDKRGHEHKKDYGFSLIDPAGLELRLAEQRQRQEINNTARQIEAIIKTGWTHNGNWYYSHGADTITNLHRLVDQLAALRPAELD